MLSLVMSGRRRGEYFNNLQTPPCHCICILWFDSTLWYSPPDELIAAAGERVVFVLYGGARSPTLATACHENDHDSLNHVLWCAYIISVG